VKTTSLNDGTRVACLRVQEARVLDRHVGGYTGHGITLPDDAVVIDAGANIGLFGVRLMQELQQARVFACEPIPDIHAVLAQNATLHGDGRMTALCCGLSSAPGRLQFTYFPNSPALSTAHLEDWDNPDAFGEAVRGAMRSSHEAIPWLRFVPMFLSGLVARVLWSKRQEVDADLITVSSLMEEHELDRIDLLKIDCEGAELHILEGVSDAHWPAIRQVVAEVNNLDGRLDAVMGLLKKHGLTQIETEVEDGFEHTTLVNVYATRGVA
jgi:FkbM family methyltransferase